MQFLDKPVWVVVDRKNGEYYSAYVTREEARHQANLYNELFGDEEKRKVKVERFVWGPRWDNGGGA